MVLALQLARRMFKREVVTPSGSMFAKLIAGAFLVGVLGSISFAPRTMKVFGESKVDIAKVAVQKFANEAYPQWQRTYGGCPHSVYELTEFIDGVQKVDPWGARYRMFCSNGRLIVTSLGEDGTPNTTDDIRSDR